MLSLLSLLSLLGLLGFEALAVASVQLLGRDRLLCSCHNLLLLLLILGRRCNDVRPLGRRCAITRSGGAALRDLSNWLRL